MKLNISKVKPFPIAGLGLAVAILTGPVQSQEQSATQAKEAAPGSYSVIDLGVVGGPPGGPYVISNNGLVSGAAATNDGRMHAALWFEGLKLDIGIPGLGGPNSAAFGVNRIAQAVGQAETSDSNAEDFCGFNSYGFTSSTACLPFLWQDGVMTKLATLGGENGYANMINSRGEVAGLAETAVKDSASSCPVHRFEPVVWGNGVIRELPTYTGDSDGVAAWINDKGDVAGASGTCAPFNPNSGLYLTENHALVWQNGKATDLGNLGPNGIPGAGNHACAINNRGEAVGHTTSDASTVAFLWSREKGMKGLGTLPGDFASFAIGINDEGQVVGQSIGTDFSSFRAFLWEKGVMTDLNTLVAVNPTKLSLLAGESINDRKEIIGLAVDGAGNYHGYLAIPEGSEAKNESTAPAVDGTNSYTAKFSENVHELIRQRWPFGQF
jgi:probable HAF family extracellular repeat protein